MITPTQLPPRVILGAGLIGEHCARSINYRTLLASKDTFANVRCSFLTRPTVQWMQVSDDSQAA